MGLCPSSGAALALSLHMLGWICVSLALVMSGAARTKGNRRLGNNKDQGKRKAKFLKANA